MKTSTFYAFAALCGIAAALVGYFGPMDAHAGALGGVTLYAAMALQTTYADNIEPAVAGMVANMRSWDGITRTCETDAGLAFGIAVSRGTDEARQCVIGGALNKFLGVTVRDPTLEVSQADKYADKQNVGILTQGEIWVQTSVSVATTDPVHYSTTTGIFAASGGIGPIRGARWMESNDGPGIARLYLSGDAQAA